jgi:hypothetical protein
LWGTAAVVAFFLAVVAEAAVCLGACALEDNTKNASTLGIMKID